MTKIYCDIADINLIKKFEKKKIVKGFTTNPSLIRKAGAKDYKNYCQKILKITKKPISFEVFADNEKDMLRQGEIINKWGKNIFVKVPVTNSKGLFMGKVIRKLNKKNIKINITAVYTAKQTAKILKVINKNTQVLISIFAGRMGDVGKNPIPEIKKSIFLAKKFKNVKILWASTREPYNFIEARKLNCDLITVPPNIIEKIEKFGKSFEKLTIDTVKGFLSDSKKSKFHI
ncbi:MAG: transaldolase [Candidatus Pelagibacter sp. TMED273]|nr:MAG: transaldolase [Candidatus Pelagibacter sp. TMED273]